MPLSSYSLDNFVAPKLSLLTTCGMPPLRFPEIPLAAVISDRIVLRRVEPRQIRLLTNALRWIDAAFTGYSGAQESLIAYSSVQRGKLTDYYMAVLRIEQCLAATDHAGVLARKLSGLNYEPSPAKYCLRKLYETSKHVDERIDKGELPDDSTIPIWLTNAGIESNDHSLSFTELAGFMEHFVGLVRREFGPHETA